MLFALAVPDVHTTAGLPLTGTAGLYGFAINKGIGPANLLGKAQFVATFGR
jgi:hypothetical protein